MDKIELLSNRLYGSRKDIEELKEKKRLIDSDIERYTRSSNRLKNLIEDEERYIEIIENTIRDLEKQTSE